ncbi:MAG: GNAT family N-acetyltransferase [Proteobacteria bacterium]|nr:GNAT family N-acetyltransferase [Pseudomonadota bacterium]
MTPGPTLTTPRLILRPPSQQDFAGLPPARPSRQPPGGRQRWLPMFSPGASGEWMVAWPWPRGASSPGDDGWALGRSMGRGLRWKAAAAMDWAFDHLGWESLIHSIDSANVASIRLAQRLGSELQRRQHRMPAPFQEVCCDIYGQTRAQWRARQRGPGIL